MVKYEKDINAELQQGEIIDSVYHQSDAYIYENPLFSVLNWLLILSFFVNCGIIIYLTAIGFTKTDPYKTSTVGASFFFVNVLLYLFSISTAGNILRSWKIPGFKYGYDYMHLNLDDDSDTEIIYPRSRYTTYFAVANGFGAAWLYFASLRMPSMDELYTIVFTITGCCALVVIFSMIWRRTHRKIAVLTDTRVLLYSVNSRRIDYIYFNSRVYVNKREDDYTITITDPKLLASEFLVESILDSYCMCSWHQHASMYLHGFKKCEVLYKKLKML